jgi:hypothetical protein
MYIVYLHNSIANTLAGFELGSSVPEADAMPRSQLFKN